MGEQPYIETAMVALDLEVGLLFFFAVGAGTELSVFIAGWSSRNKYALRAVLEAGAHRLVWDGRSAERRPAPAGVYFVRVRTGAGDLSRKVVVVR